MSEIKNFFNKTNWLCEYETVSVYDDSTGKTRIIEGNFIQNECGVSLNDIFMTRYRGMNIFLCVAKTHAKEVAVFELDTKIVPLKDNPNDGVEIIKSPFTPRKRPLLISKNNCFTKTEFWVPTLSNGQLRIRIKENMPICEYDRLNGFEPRFVNLKCYPIKRIVEGSGWTYCQFPFPFIKKVKWPKQMKYKEVLALC